MSAFEAKQLTLRKELTELERLGSWIEGYAALRSAPELLLAVQLCLEEAVAIVIMYGAPKSGELKISVCLCHCEGMLVARVKDNGQEFDPTQAPPFEAAQTLHNAEGGNIGIHLMRNFADAIDYERRGGCNQLTLRFI